MANQKLFDQSLNASPSSSQRLAFATPSAATENMTFTQLISYLEGVLGFLKQSQNLADLDSAATARTNLGVYSSGETDTLLADKADLYDAVTPGGALAANNATTVTPSSDYNPATKKYVDDSLGGLTVLWAGTIVSDATAAVTKYGGSLTVTASRLGNGFYRLTHSKGDTDYMAFHIVSTSGQDSNKAAAIVKAANTLDIGIGPDSNFSDSGSNVDVLMLGF